MPKPGLCEAKASVAAAHVARKFGRPSAVVIALRAPPDEGVDGYFPRREPDVTPHTYGLSIRSPAKTWACSRYLPFPSRFSELPIEPLGLPNWRPLTSPNLTDKSTGP